MQKEKTKARKNRQESPLSSRLNHFKQGIERYKSRSRKCKAKSSTNEHFLTTNNLKELYSSVDGIDENKASEIIKQIYPIIKDEISIFISPNFNEQTKATNFLYWMMNCYSDIYGEFWEIANYGDDYVLNRVYEYDIEMRGYSSELIFLKEVKDKELHDLFIIAFSLLQKTGTPFWRDSYSNEMAVDVVKEERAHLLSIGKEAYSDEIDNYQKAINEINDQEILYQKLLNNKETDKDLKRRLSLYFVNRDTNDDKVLVNFFDKLIELVSIKDCINAYVFAFEHETEEGQPMMPNDYAVIGYNYDIETSVLAANENEYSEMNYNEYGILPYRMLIQNEEEDLELSDYPYRYIDLLESITKVESLFS